MKKKLSKKFILGAAALMAFSTGATITGTYAWFVASNVVTVAGPTIQAQAEEGIVIAAEKATAYTDSDWAQSVTALYNGAGTSYIPTSTVKGQTWYHGNAENVDNHSAGTGDNAVKTINDVVVASGVASSATLGGKHIYLVNKFSIQASAKADLGNHDLVVNALTATANSSNSTALNKSLRVLFVLDTDKDGIVDDGESACLYAPFADSASVSYDVNGVTNAATAYKTVGTSDTLLSNGTISAYTTAGTNALNVLTFAYFEGEDENCKTANIAANLDTITLTFKFENKVHN